MYPTRYAQVRDRRSWQATVSGLIADDDGRLSLAKIPALAPPEDAVGPWDCSSSGLAAAACCSVFVADTAGARIVYRDGLCHDSVVLPGPGGDAAAPMFVTPRGIAINRFRLAVADPGQGAVLLFTIDELRQLGRLRQGLVAPWAVAFSDDGALFVLDGTPSRLLRLEANGQPDAAFARAVASRITDPSALAAGDNNTMFVVDAGTRQVCRFTAQGAPVDAPLTGPPGWQPGAIAARGLRLFVADVATGRIGIFEAGRFLGDVPGFRGPVSALAVGEDGQLFIKCGQDEVVLIACADTAVVDRGEVLCGPWDAGERDGWERAVVDAVVPQWASVQLDVYFADNESPPTASAWLPSPSGDVWLDSLSPLSQAAPARRFLWLRVRLSASAQGDSPVLAQLRAATADEDYRRHLPSVYAEQDADAVLQRMLALARGEIGDGERALADLPRTFSAQFLPSGDLAWLAGWLAFGLPDGLEVDARRAVLARVQDLYLRRGTLAGMLEFLHLYTGVRARLIEPFRHRHLWQLDSAALGFDTGLPPAAADGMLVADSNLLRDTDPTWGCAPERVVVGHAVVGVDRPVERGDLGSVLFDDQAHRITVLIPAGQAPDAETRRRIRAVIDAEAPAHVVCEVCFIEPPLRLGMTASIGIDTIVAGDGAPLRLAQSHWNQDAQLGGAVRGVGSGQPARIGSSLVLG